MLQVKNLEISFKNAASVIQEVSFNVQQTQILGIVGESGSGKSITSLAILGLLPKYATITGEILFKEQNVLNYKNSDFQKIRGSQIAMIFQEPMSSLNPTLTCGFQVAEVLELHTNLSKKEIKQAVILLFEKVKLPRPMAIFNAYPHQISGGQKQRVMIAMAIACKPQLLIADEPTTALDVTVQKEIIALLKELQQEYKMGIIFISHDLGLVSEIADTVVVMRKGKVVEQGITKELFLHPKENYTKALIKSKPTLKKRFKILPTVIDFIKNTVKTEVYTDEERKEFHQKIYAKTPLLEIKNLHKEYVSKVGWFSKRTVVKAVNDVSFKIYQGETVGLVGESGCGKTTLGSSILQLEKATSGQIIYKGEDITRLSKKALKKLRKDIQIIFQDPFSSLNPRITVGNAIVEPMKVHNILNSFKERKEYVLNLLEKVGLEKAHFDRYPHEFSGGQRQRIGIARTIALQPKLIICDESVSALDVSVQAQVLNLLNELKAEFNFTYLFISHDLSVVKYMSDQLVVMNKGQIEEIADADEIYNNPKTSYTKTLIAAIPKGL
ncbi:ABC transporter ATP-binding protein [Tenacibaculum finnmarkense]|uniref:Glutathione import ATP-binding protein GsiA n=1 Tax=Tenacibaculum finnmarkense genomovar ulcerans TaxID=2781388 RepID=A0A2I2LEX0_9FLAO|nr:ABC transporter ATP-binding protein [Tenacibaculum finnmarkense]ALU73862.1 ABC transporter ATP-binding protein [Tenacibaculum dicentrarchi]MBE7696745.1 dipeptide ABC transporter ATP-binding protein [Tenacibaculum finnmarkense genomovar ulcerans]MCG8749481.1 ABC transporter ATP-binding protein [Tenacibaculum finnmarkense]MCG8754497.1 ABC transporter ATP-binding protein [Tenacibaculum finnmarkense]MCG8783194.1 ABC transporter ATP-binding protein [Tenacibaculum finnmarkense]